MYFEYTNAQNSTIKDSPLMSNKNKIFYRGKTEVIVDFSAKEISSDGAVILLEKLEKKYKILDHFSASISDTRQSWKVKYSINNLVKLRCFMLMQGYEDTNDVNHLKNDPVFKDVLSSDLASQPTLSRFENNISKQDIFHLCSTWLDRYITSLKGREQVIIDVDATDDPTHGNQQLSMFNGYYGQFMYTQLFFHDGQTGQIILPVLRPGNSHSNKWFIAILKRIIERIQEKYPTIEIIIRADGGFNGAPFYELADKYSLKYAIGLPTNQVLKRKVEKVQKAVQFLYVKENKKHQHFISFSYQAKSWHQSQTCYAKIESTGIGINIRYFVSNLEKQTAREIYTDFYIKRGETSENRIKEVKNMCFSDRLSNHTFWANFFRLLLSSLAYQMFLALKQEIKKTSFQIADQWQIDTIRTRLLKIGATIKKTKRRIYYHFSKAFVYQDLFLELIKL